MPGFQLCNEVCNKMKLYFTKTYRCKVEYWVYHLKHNAVTIMYYSTKMKSEAGPPQHDRYFPSPQRHFLESRSPWLIGRCSSQLCKSCSREHMLHSRAERVFILTHYFIRKLFYDVHEVFSSAYPDKDTSTGNKMLGHRERLFLQGSGGCLLWSWCVSSSYN
jgi:hypothetical protein